MKKVFFGIIIGLLAGGVGAWLVFRDHHAAGGEEKTEGHKAASRLMEGTNGETYLKLDAEAQSKAGIKVTVLAAAELKPEIKAFGRVLDPALLAVGVQEMRASAAQLEASEKDYSRLKILFDQNQNVSARALETAQASVRRDEIVRQTAQLRFITTWGPAIDATKDASALLAELAAQKASLVRVDVPAGEKLLGEPAAARIAALSAPEQWWEGKLLGAAVAVDPQTLGRGYLFLVKGPALAAQSVVTALLSLPGEEEKGVVIPRDSIVRHEGEAFIYVQSGDERFERHEIELEHPLAGGWFVENLKAGVKVVTTGAQQLLSEEFKAEGGGE